jgi:hypothetical protein
MGFRLSALIIIAALCLSGAAILPSAPAAAQRRTTKRKPAAPVATKPTPAPTVAPDPTPVPVKANSRPADAQAAIAPAPQTSGTPANEQKNVSATAAARYYYEFNQPDFYLRHIVIEHDATGRGQMTFERKPDAEAYTDPLEIAPAALARISAAWAALNFLDSTEDYQTNRSMAHLGTMRLRMTTGPRTRTAEFNWTHNPNAAVLMNEYRRIADQQLFVFEVNIARQYQPSDTVKLLKGLESLINRAAISDGPQLIPLLSDLVNDERIPLIARNQAERLIKQIKK